MSEQKAMRRPDFVLRVPWHGARCDGSCHPSHDYGIDVSHGELLIRCTIPRCNTAPGVCVQELLQEVYDAGVERGHYPNWLVPAYRTGYYNQFAYYWLHIVKAKKCVCCKCEAVVDGMGEADGWLQARELYTPIREASAYHLSRWRFATVVCCPTCIGNVEQLCCRVINCIFRESQDFPPTHDIRICSGCGDPSGNLEPLTRFEVVCPDCSAAAIEWACQIGLAAKQREEEISCVRETGKLLRKARVELRKNNRDALQSLGQEFARVASSQK